ncbi:MAG: response regulator [Anaerolineae bacterium]|nr:response regulator [Anaerolineae bacterium]
MDDDNILVLLIEDNAGHARLVEATVDRSRMAFDIVHVKTLSEALARLEERHFDAVLLDLTLPDAAGLDTVNEMQRVAPDLPIVVLTGLDDEQLAMRAVKAGAQDYLIKGRMDMQWLVPSIRYAIERQRTQAEQRRHIERLALLRRVDDELTRRLDVEYVLMMGLDTAVRLSVASAGLVALLEEGKVTHVQVIKYARKEVAEQGLLTVASIARAVRERQAIMLADGDADFSPLLPTMHSQIVLPLLSQSRVVGFLALETTDPARFTESTYDFLKLLAARIAVAVDNAYLYQATQDQLRELTTLYEQVRNLEQLKTDMIRIAAHDLRGPLSNVLGYIYLLRQNMGQEIPKLQYDYLNFIEASAERIKRILDDILSLERFESMGDIDKQAVRLDELVKQAYQESEDQSRQKSQQFDLEMPAHAVVVRGDRTLLYEAVVNIINNAIKYTADGGRVCVRLQQTDTRAIFVVDDTGIGIPKDQQKRLFQPFFRARSPETKHVDGTGLGLHLVKNIIERHNGEMIFRSTYNEGSTFGFRLPLFA